MKNQLLKDGEPCNCPGCLSHVSYPCKGCGRIKSKPKYIPKDMDDYKIHLRKMINDIMEELE